MTLQNIVKLVNENLAGETLSYAKMRKYLDSAIDEINQNLNSCYPVFSEIASDATEYAYFPDRYIRTVVCTGAAFYFYQTDEEGINAAPGIQGEFQKNLFYMQRDFIHAVPADYQDSEWNGTIPLKLEGAAEVTNFDFNEVRI